MPQWHHALRRRVCVQPLSSRGGFQQLHLLVRALPAGNDYMQQRRRPWIECVLPA